MAFNTRRVTLSLATALMLGAGACSSSESSDALAEVEDAPVSAEAETETTEAVEAAEEAEDVSSVDAAVAELSPEQQEMLSTCAESLNSSAGGIDPASETYIDDVAGVLMAPDSDALANCTELFDPASGIEQAVLISYMVEALPPELLVAVMEIVPVAVEDAVGGAVDEDTMDMEEDDTMDEDTMDMEEDDTLN